MVLALLNMKGLKLDGMTRVLVVLARSIKSAAAKAPIVRDPLVVDI